jgi:hypothetical protein
MQHCETGDCYKGAGRSRSSPWRPGWTARGMLKIAGGGRSYAVTRGGWRRARADGLGWIAPHRAAAGSGNSASAPRSCRVNVQSMDHETEAGAVLKSHHLRASA